MAAPLAALALLVVAAPAHAYIYWDNTGNGTITRANLNGTAVNHRFIMGATNLDGVAVDGARIYWTTNGAIGRANLDGTSVDQSFITGGSEPVGVAVDGAHIYWSNGDGAIGRANLDGTNVDQSFITAITSPYGIAVDGAHIYWANPNGTIGRANLDGTGVNQSFITVATNPTGVVVNGAHIYWTNEGNGTIGRGSLEGTGVNNDFITGGTQPWGVAVDGAHIYWINEGIGTIGRADLNGMSVDQHFISAAGTRVNNIAVDALGPASVPPPAKKVPVRIVPVWKWNNGHTQLTALTFRHLPADAVIVITCVGRGCPAASWTAKATDVSSLAGRLKGRSLDVGTRLTVTINVPGRQPERALFVTRYGQRPSATLISGASTPGQAIRSCSLRISLGPVGAGLGHAGVPIRFQNEHGTCSLRGYPDVEGLSAHGRTMFRARHTLQGYLGGARRVSTITLTPGETASALLEGSNFAVPGLPCPSYRYLRITPPHAVRSVRLQVHPFCYPVFVHPVVPGSSGGIN